MQKVAVVGLGYVGLPLTLLAEEKGFDVVGIDVSKEKIKTLNHRKPAIDDEEVRQKIKTTKVKYTTDFSELESRDIVIVCVPTPVNEKRLPDLTILKNAVATVSKHLKKGALLNIESTINPGVCDEAIIPTIEKESNHIVGKTLHVSHCPERLIPGDPKWTTRNINRVLGADSEKSLDMAYKFYSKLIEAKVKKMGSIKEAEACKVFENSFRDVNIAFVNEVAMSFSKLGINILNVIEGSSTKPFAFLPHYPGMGIGGHCIPVDPYYLIEYAKQNGFEHKFLNLARSINDSMPIYAVDLVEKALIERAKKSLKNSKVAVLGLAYKGDVADDRESTAYIAIDALKARGAKVTRFDPYIPEKSDAKTLKEALSGKDAAIIDAGHKQFLELEPKDFAGLTVLLDGRNHLKDKKDAIIKTGVHYIGIGT